MVIFDDVSLRYEQGPYILQNLSFRLETGSFHFLTGPSGAGKSSLLRLIFLATRPTQGKISLFGRDTVTLTRKEIPALRRRIGVVFQDFRLLDHLTALENVALPLRIAGMPNEEIEHHVSELLTWVGLSDRLHALPQTLSGGQQQRVAIARAVIARPRLLLADEPTGNVDNTVAIRLLYLFEELNRIGTTVVIASHNEALISRFNHHIISLSDGRLSPKVPGSLTASAVSRQLDRAHDQGAGG